MTSKITLNLNDDAIAILQEALDEHPEGWTVKQYLEHEINNNAEALVETLLSDW